MNEKKQYKGILKATSLFGWAQGSRIILDLLRINLASDLLGPAGMGLNTIYNETREWLHETTNLGMDASGVRGISVAYEHWDAENSDMQKRAEAAQLLERQVLLLRSWVMVLAIFGTLLTILCAPLLSSLSFGDWDHTIHFMLLSPTIGLSTLTCGEITILKGTRLLKKLAIISVLNVLAALIISYPTYLFLGKEGVIPALLLFSLSSLIITAAVSYRYYSPRFEFSIAVMKEAIPVIILGTTIAISAFVVHGVEFLIRAYLNRASGEATVGIYNSGYIITMSVASIVFAAIEADYFPRLSGIVSQIEERTKAIAQQAHMGLIILSPIAIAVMVALPIIVPILFNEEFVEAVPMAQIAIIGLIFRSLYLPQAYLPLAAGHTGTFFLLNLLGAICSLSVIVGFYYGGLNGAGIGLLAAHVADMLLAIIFLRSRYSIVLPRVIWTDLLQYLLLTAIAYICTLYAKGIGYWFMGFAIIIATGMVSYNKYMNMVKE